MKNPKVVFLSIIALFFILLTFFIDWIFIIPAAIISFVNWKILMKDK